MSIRRRPAVSAETGLPTATLYAEIRSGRFTRPVRIGGARSVGWPADEVAAINAARIAGYTDAQLRELVEQLHAKRASLAPLVNV